MKLNVAVIAVAAMFSVAAARPMIEAEKLAEGPHSAYAPGKFAQGASATAPLERFMSPSRASTGSSERLSVSDKPTVAESTAAYRERYEDPTRLQDPSERAEVISNHLVEMFPPQGPRPELMGYRFLRQAAKLISEGTEQDPSAKDLSEHLNLIATVIEQQGALNKETRAGFQQAFFEYLKFHPTVRGKYSTMMNTIARDQAAWPDRVTQALRQIATRDQFLNEQNQVLNHRLYQTERLVNALYSVLPPKDRQAVVSLVAEHQARDREAFGPKQEQLRRANTHGAELYPQGESHFATAPAYPVTKQSSAEAEHTYGRAPQNQDAAFKPTVAKSESHYSSADEDLDDPWDNGSSDDEVFYDGQDQGEKPTDFDNGRRAVQKTPEPHEKADQSQVASSTPLTANTHAAPSVEKAAPAPGPVHQ